MLIAPGLGYGLGNQGPALEVEVKSRLLPNEEAWRGCQRDNLDVPSSQGTEATWPE